MTVQEMQTDEGLITEVAQQVAILNLKPGIKKALGGILGLIAGGVVYAIVAQPPFLFNKGK